MDYMFLLQISKRRKPTGRKESEKGIGSWIDRPKKDGASEEMERPEEEEGEGDGGKYVCLLVINESSEAQTNKDKNWEQKSLGKRTPSFLNKARAS